MSVSAEGQLGPVFHQFWLTLALVGFPGILGGLTNGVSAFLKASQLDGEEWPPSGHLSKLSFYGAQAITGFGGSLAALLVTLWANRFPKDLMDLQSLLTLTCTGFVSGYVANRLLPAIADGLYQKLTQLTEKQSVLERKTEEETRNAVNLSTELTRARDYLSGKTFVTGQTEKLLSSLSSLAKTYPTNRVLHILLSRTWYEASKNAERALEVLEDFINAKRAAHEIDEDLATAYWNSANYFEYAFKERKSQNARAKALEALRRCLEISPSYLQELIRDSDFQDLRESAEGNRLVTEFSPSQTTGLHTTSNVPGESR